MANEYIVPASADLALRKTLAVRVDPSDPIAELERLAQLHASGAPTDAEFAQAKAKVLGS